MFFCMLDVAIYNAFVLYSNLPTSKKQSIVNFWLNIAEDMLSNWNLPKYPSLGWPLQGECPTRLQPKNMFVFWGLFWLLGWLSLMSFLKLSKLMELEELKVNLQMVFQYLAASFWCITVTKNWVKCYGMVL